MQSFHFHHKMVFCGNFDKDLANLYPVSKFWSSSKCWEHHEDHSFWKPFSVPHLLLLYTVFCFVSFFIEFHIDVREIEVKINKTTSVNVPYTSLKGKRTVSRWTGEQYQVNMRTSLKVYLMRMTVWPSTGLLPCREGKTVIRMASTFLRSLSYSNKA